MSDDPTAASPRRPSRTFVRRVVYPVLVILAIVAVIVWLERANSDNTSSVSGQEFGIRALNPHLNPNNLDVEASEGAMAPDFELEKVASYASTSTPNESSTDGEAWLSDFRGHPVVLNFWATWCQPCRKEAPLFVQAYDKYRSDGLVIIGLDEQEGAGTIQPFARDFGMNYPLLIDRDGEVSQKYRLLGLPTTFFIDADGVIQSIYRGETNGGIDQSSLEAAIAKILHKTIVPSGTTPEAPSGSR